MKVNKYKYLKIIQQNYGQGWEDVSEYETNSAYTFNEGSGKFRELKSGRKVEIPLITHDYKEYNLTGYPTRVVRRKELNNL